MTSGNPQAPVAAVLIDPTTGLAYQSLGTMAAPKVSVQEVIAVVRVDPVTGIPYL